MLNIRGSPVFQNSFCLSLNVSLYTHYSLGYAGRTELPDNLKSMFRPISMVVPDSTLIAEIILFGEGFNNCKVLLVKRNSYTNSVLNKRGHKHIFSKCAFVDIF